MSKSHHCVRSRRIWKNHTKIYRNGGREYSSLNVKEHDRYGIVVEDIRRYKGDTWSTGDYYRRSKQMTRNKGQSRNKYDEKDCSNLATLVENTSPHILYIGLISIMTEGLFQLLLFFFNHIVIFIVSNPCWELVLWLQILFCFSQDDKTKLRSSRSSNITSPATAPSTATPSLSATWLPPMLRITLGPNLASVFRCS